MHRVVLPCEPGMVPDHINRNTLHNFRGNLRLVTQAQNSRNRDIANPSGFPGVCYAKRHKKWQASISINGKKKFLGYYSTPAEASKVYRQAVIGDSGWFPVDLHR